MDLLPRYTRLLAAAVSFVSLLLAVAHPAIPSRRALLMAGSNGQKAGVQDPVARRQENARLRGGSGATARQPPPDPYAWWVRHMRARGGGPRFASMHHASAPIAYVCLLAAQATPADGSRSS
jgi:hypothetical protein